MLGESFFSGKFKFLVNVISRARWRKENRTSREKCCWETLEGFG